MVEGDSWYAVVDGQDLEQGDLIKQCPIYVPEYRTFEDVNSEGKVQYQIFGKEYTYDVVVMTQSCDLRPGKVQFVVVCAYWSLEEMISTNEKLRPKKVQEKIRQGNLPHYHMLDACTFEEKNYRVQIVDFHHTFTVPYDFLRLFAGSCGKRLRLQSPYREKMSQAFGNFFARVGLPKDIPSFA